MLREATITLDRDNRDKGGVFVLREKPAWQASEWFMRAMLLLARSGADVPANLLQHGAAGFVTLGLGSMLTGMGKAPWGEVKPLLDELLQCVVSYQPPGAVQGIENRTTIMGQIQEISTILQMYEEVLSLHLGFSLAERLSSYRAFVGAMMTENLGPNTPT